MWFSIAVWMRVSRKVQSQLSGGHCVIAVVNSCEIGTKIAWPSTSAYAELLISPESYGLVPLVPFST